MKKHESPKGLKEIVENYNPRELAKIVYGSNHVICTKWNGHKTDQTTYELKDDGQFQVKESREYYANIYPGITNHCFYYEADKEQCWEVVVRSPEIEKIRATWNSNLKIYMEEFIREGKTVRFEITDAFPFEGYRSGLSSLQSARELLSYIGKYAEEWIAETGTCLPVYLECPELEILDKAGYKFVRMFMLPPEMYSRRYIEKSEVAAFNRLVKKGSSPGEILSVSKNVRTLLKNEPDIRVWDIFRKLEKLNQTSDADLKELYEWSPTPVQMSYIYTVLRHSHQGKKTFSTTSLINYLHRVDVNEAIERNEALMLLKDYLGMCSQMGVAPKIDGDSLKREHDVMARNCRNKRDEELAKKFENGYGERHQYDYAEGEYFVRGIDDYDDLVNEASQQHNCLASYAKNIVEGASVIYLLRQKKDPGRSFVTIELSPDCSVVRQALHAYNMPITNPEIKKLVERFRIHAQKICGGQQPSGMLEIA